MASIKNPCKPNIDMTGKAYEEERENLLKKNKQVKSPFYDMPQQVKIVYFSTG
jgi:hypothetical protein